MNARFLLAASLGLTMVSGAALAEEDPPPPTPGAAIDEARIQKTYYVDAAATDVANASVLGTQAFPFKRISQACEAAARDKDSGVGVKILVADGVYREAVSFPAPKRAGADTDAPLVIEAVNRQQAIIDGADSAGWEASGWQRDGLTWTHSWPSPRNLSPEPSRPPGTPKAPNEIARRGELIFLNGMGLRQALTPAELAPGGFCVVSAPENSPRKKGAPAAGKALTAGTVTMRLPEDADADSASIEASARDCGLIVQDRRNVVIRGLTIQHVGSFPESDWPGGLVLKGCSGVLVEDVLAQWNNAAGLVIVGRDAAPWSAGITLRRVQLLYNGRSGLAAANLKNLLVEDCETSFNNFRGDWSGWIDAAGPAGCKARGIHGGVWRRHHAVGNWCRGLWWESDCSDIAVEDSAARGNLISGLLIENSPGPAAVRRCAVSGTKPHASVREELAFPAAVSICAAANVTLESNIIACNFVPQLGLWDAARSEGINFETKAREVRRAEKHIYRRNVFLGLEADQILCHLPGMDRTGKLLFDFYYGTLNADENCFWNPARAEVFCTYDRTNLHRPGINLAGWRTFLATRAGAASGRQPEGASLWQDPLFVEPAEGDFRLKPDSPAAAWNLTADEQAPGQ